MFTDHPSVPNPRIKPDPWNPALTRRDSRAHNLNRTLTTRPTSNTKINVRVARAVPVNPANDQG
jgi:hypothetical protein